MQTHRVGFLAQSLVLCVALGLMTFGAEAVAGDRQHGITAFDRRVAGSYITPEGDFFGHPLRGMITINADGTLSSADTSDYGALPAGFPYFQSEGRGSWKQSGPRQLTFVTLGFDFFEDGTFTGMLRSRGTYTFDRSFNEFQAEGVLEVLAPDADPLGDQVVATIPLSFEARRIPARLP